MSERKAAGLAALMADGVIACAGYYVGFYFRFGRNIPAANLRAYTANLPYIFALAMILCWLFRLRLSSRGSTLENIYNIGLSVVFLNLGTMAITYINRQFAFPRSVFIVSAVVQFAALSLWRIAMEAFGRSRQRVRPAVVLSTNGQGWRLANRLESCLGSEYKVIKVCNTHTLSDALSSLEPAQTVFMDQSISPAIKREIIEHCLLTDKQAIIVPGVYDIVMQNARVSAVDDIAVFEIESLALTPSQQAVKRISDLLLSATLLLITSPLFLLIGIAVKLTSPGPVFYRQLRVGFDGNHFELNKFRTMVHNAELATGPVLASACDSRVTRIGRLLRPTRLDELPQLLNILKGEMSFVGPRPERPYFVDQFSSAIPGYSYRSKVKPGLTGLAQVAGKYTTDPEAKLRFDLYYIRNYSLVLDIQIILQTLRVVLTPESARGTADATEVAATHSSNTDTPI